MAISRQAYKALESVTGSKYISEDPVIMQGYKSGPGGYEAGLGYERVMTVLPAAVILPKDTEEVQKIVKICNRYHIPYVPYATGFYGPKTHCHVDDELIIDMKRMQQFSWDEKHMYADIGPGVIYSSLQQEAFNQGCYGVIGGGGAQCSAIANLLGDGWSPLSLKIGLPHRRILGTELVLPDGEIVRMGSLAGSDDPFWGEGPGPDLRCILRGFTGLRGCLGIVTRMAVKYLPFIQESPKPQGIAPNTSLALDEKRIRWINYQVPTKEDQVKAMYEIGAAEIGAACTKVPVFWRAIAKAEDKEEFWDIWLKESEESLKNFHLVRVMLIGYASEEQMDYELAVLDDIMQECHGKPRRTKPSDESWLKNADSAGMWLMTGSYVSVEFVIESLNQSVQHGESFAALKASEYTASLPGLRRSRLVPGIRMRPPGLLRIPHLLGSGRRYFRRRQILPADVQDEYREQLLFFSPWPSPASVPHWSSVWSKLSPLAAQGQERVRPGLDLPPTCTSRTRYLRTESRVDARYDRLGSSGEVPYAKLDCYSYKRSVA